MIEILSDYELEQMRQAGKIVAKVFKAMEENVKPGVSTFELNKIAYDIIVGEGATPSFLNYGTPPFPGSICASLNDAVVHGIPSEKVILKDGDIISVDVGAYLNGFHADAARTYLVGNVDQKVKDLVERTKQSFFEGLKYCQEGYRIGDISHAVEEYAESFGYGVVKPLTGHGIGRKLHMEPDVPNYGRAGKGPRIKNGMAICIEPMINLGTEDVAILDDQWTIVTADGLPSAHYENTVLITANGPELTTIEKVLEG